MIVFKEGNDQLTLRNPEMPVSVNINAKIRIMQTMGGTYRTHKSTPVTYVHTLNIIGLCRDKAYETEAFLVAKRGKILRYVDPFGDEWTGKITNNPTDIVHAEANASSVSLTFEGVRV